MPTGTDYYVGQDNPLQSYHYSPDKSSPRREYFSGANVRVYFGNVWVDELTEISFSLQEQVAPIYGFHSYTFDRISRGSRMVQGTFSINFTENGYLKSILDLIERDMQENRTELAVPEMDNYIRSNNELETIHDLLEIDDRGTYLQQVSALKQSFWGSRETTGSIVPIKENDSYYYTQMGDGRSVLRENGFNILIDYSPDANQKDFQDCLNDIASGRSSFQTYRNIIGVHIGSESQSVTNNGQVISQTYQFVAQDLDGDITKPSLYYK